MRSLGIGSNAELTIATFKKKNRPTPIKSVILGINIASKEDKPILKFILDL